VGANGCGRLREIEPPSNMRGKPIALCAAAHLGAVSPTLQPALQRPHPLQHCRLSPLATPQLAPPALPSRSRRSAGPTQLPHALTLHFLPHQNCHPLDGPLATPYAMSMDTVRQQRRSIVFLAETIQDATKEGAMPVLKKPP